MWIFEHRDENFGYTTSTVHLKRFLTGNVWKLYDSMMTL